MVCLVWICYDFFLSTAIAANMVFLGEFPDLSDVSHWCIHTWNLWTKIEKKSRKFKMGNWLTKCDLNPCFRIQMSSVSSSLLTSSDDEDVDFLVDERKYARKVNGGGGQQLPWHENYWSIKITHVVAPGEVWAILTKDAVTKMQSSYFFSIWIFKFMCLCCICLCFCFDIGFVGSSRTDGIGFDIEIGKTYCYRSHIHFET